jgi:hypothetical protein
MRIETKGDAGDLSTKECEGLPDDPEPGKVYRKVRGGKTVAARLRRHD